MCQNYVCTWFFINVQLRNYISDISHFLTKSLIGFINLPIFTDQFYSIFLLVSLVDGQLIFEKANTLTVQVQEYKKIFTSSVFKENLVVQSQSKFRHSSQVYLHLDSTTYLTTNHLSLYTDLQYKCTCITSIRHENTIITIIQKTCTYHLYYTLSVITKQMLEHCGPSLKCMGIYSYS